MKSVVSLVLIFWVVSASAQQGALKKRYSFAKAYFGTDFSYFYLLEQSTFLDGQNQIRQFDRAGFVVPAINFGATHFWGHADFFVSIATASRKMPADELENEIGFRAITGMRVFPMAIRERTVRPYLSYKFAPIRLNQQDVAGGQYRRTQVKSIVGLGLAYLSPKIYAYAAYEIIPDNDATIYLSRTQTGSSSFPRGVFNVGINYSLELTSGSYSAPVRQLDAMLRSRNMLGWFFGAGPSSAFPIRRSSYLSDLYPFLDDLSMPGVFPELTAGYHFSKQDVLVAANFRPMRQERNAFSFHQRIVRNSFGLEASKFLFDYHGFAPFVGAGVLYESIQLVERDRSVTVTDKRYQFTTPSLVFGWDIRPSKRADFWLLRTNLRYAPGLEVLKDDRKLSLQHVEFNFIQAVFYPQRFRKYKSLR